MGTIQSSIGLITGVPIAETVDQLIALSAQPRDRLIERTAALGAQQVAVTELTALVIGIQFATKRLGDPATFDEVQATSSNPSLLDVTVTGTPTVGTYQYTPVRQAQSHQLISSGFANDDQPIGAGSLRFRFGGFVDQAKDLSQLNGGNGIQRGQIRITDRSGASAVVDLRFAQSIDDVIEEINNQSTINVTAVTDGDRLKLIDNTGLTASNLKVEQFGLGTTAIDLGLDGIDVASSTATGQDILSLHSSISLSQLNDGNGVNFGVLNDLSITFKDGSNLDIDLTAAGTPSSLGDVIDAINAADPARLTAQISASGDSIELTDLTAGGGNFTVSNSAGSTAAEDLGIATSTSGATISSRRLQSGLRTALLTSLGGGNSLGTLGDLVVTDRNGASATINLAAAESLEDVVNLINADPTTNVTARINDGRNGIEIEDSSGGSGNLIIANGGDGTDTADKLRVTVNSAVASIDSGSLDLQVINENTLISSLNNGEGVQQGSFTITDTNGSTGAVNLAVLQPTSVGEIIDAINALGLGLQAEINAEGDGIRLRDTAFGAGSIEVEDSGNGTAAAELQIAGTSTSVDIGGTPTHVINGSTTIQIDIDATDTLTDLIDKINGLDAGVVASSLNVGSGANPFRLSLISQISGRAGELQIDASQAGFSVQELAAAQDALLLVGSPDSLGAGLLVTSSSDQFDDVLDGATLTINSPSTSPVTVFVDSDDQTLINEVQLFVDQYNSLLDKLEELAFFNESDGTTGILFGTNEVLRIESGLTRLITDRYFGVGDIQSLEELGVSLDDEGKLSLDQTKLEGKIASDADAVEEFFTDENFGMSAKFDAMIDSLAGEGNSLLVNRAETLQARIDDNNERIEILSARLERERVRLFNEFFQLESVIGQLQANLSVLSTIQPIPPLSSTSSAI